MKKWPKVTPLQRAELGGKQDPCFQLLSLQKEGGRGRAKGDGSQGATQSPGWVMARRDPHMGPKTTEQNHGAAMP